MKRPRARSDDQLLSRHLNDELVIYDKRHNRAHCLNRAATSLWRKCDGKTTIVCLAAELDMDLNQQEREAIVISGVDQFREAELLTCSKTDTTSRSTRRDLLYKLTQVSSYAVFLPLVTSILAPTPAMAQTGLPNGAPCLSSSQCISGCCNAGSLKCVGAGNCLP